MKLAGSFNGAKTLYVKSARQTFFLTSWLIFFLIAIITPVFSVTWSFRNHFNVLIWCSRNISYYKCWTKLILIWQEKVCINILNFLCCCFYKESYISFLMMLFFFNLCSHTHTFLLYNPQNISKWQKICFVWKMYKCFVELHLSDCFFIINWIEQKRHTI